VLGDDLGRDRSGGFEDIHARPLNGVGKRRLGRGQS
jgi:hypothetical protein